MTIFANDPTKYTQALDSIEYENVQDLETVWDNFTPDTPGTTEMITVSGKTVYDLVEELLQEGFYFAECRDD